MARKTKAASDHDDASIDWRALYKLADGIASLAPWTWIFEDQMFAVQDPGSGELGICSIMGHSGEHLALAVYRGAEGMAGYERLRDVIDEEAASEAYVQQKAFQLSFESRQMLDPKDHAIVKTLGLKYRGANSWPLFRSQQPGYLPWHLTPSEATMLRVVLEQVLVVLPRFKAAPETMVPNHPGQLPCRVYRDGAWKDQWIATPVSADAAPAPTLDAGTMTELKDRLGGPRRGTWEIGLVAMGGRMQDKAGERPYLGLIVLLAEANSGFIGGAEAIRPAEKASAFLASVQQTFARMPGLPVEIRVCREDLYAWLVPLAAALNTPLSRRRALPALDRAKHSLLGGFGM